MDGRRQLASTTLAAVVHSLLAHRVFPHVAWVTLGFMVLVILWGTVVWIAADSARYGSPRTKRLAATVSIVVLSQFFIGIANFFFLTPLSIQVIHLLVADVLWLSFVLFGASWLGDPVGVQARERVHA